jgi:hypothetical protein
MEYGFITANSFGYKELLIFKTRQKVTAKCGEHFFVWGSYMFQRVDACEF